MKKTFFITACIAIVMVSSAVFAPECLANGVPDQTFDNPLNTDITDLMTLLETIIQDIIIPIGVIVVVFFIIWSGFLFVTAGGSEEKIKKARTTFTWTMIGAAILLGAWAITTTIEATICEIAPDTPGCQEDS